MQTTLNILIPTCILLTFSALAIAISSPSFTAKQRRSLILVAFFLVFSFLTLCAFKL